MFLNKAFGFLYLLSFCTFLLKAQNLITISINSEGYQEKEVSISVDNFFIPGSAASKTLPLSSGAGSINLSVDKPALIAIKTSKKSSYVFVEPGINPDVTLLNQGADLKVTGPGGGSNEAFQALLAQFPSEQTRTEQCLKMGVDEWEMLLFSNKKAQHDLLTKKCADKNCSETFVTWARQWIDYDYYRWLYSYSIIRAQKNDKTTEVSPLPQIMLQNFDPKLAQNDQALTVPSYRDFLVSYVAYNTSASNGFNKFQTPSAAFDSRCGYSIQNLTGYSLLYTMARLFVEMSKTVEATSLKNMYEFMNNEEVKFPPLDNNNSFARLVYMNCKEEINRKEPSTTKETPATQSKNKDDKTTASKPESAQKHLALQTLDGKTKSIGDYKGKVVYVDFWASWCGPCRQQFPYARQLKEKFTAKELKKIVFLYVSIDNTEEIWKDAIKKFSIEGEHLFSPGSWKSEVTKYYQISSIPRYMLLDSKGNIVEANAPRPSSEQIYQKIKDLIP